MDAMVRPGAASRTAALAEAGFLDVCGQRLEYRFTGPGPQDAPTIVLLHEGLGCAGLWGAFPELLRKKTGAGVFAYSRAGYGASSPVPLPRPLDYMQREAREVLPHVIDAVNPQCLLLVGHSDGASIAAVHAGAFADDTRLSGVSLIAPHFFVEEMCVAAIAETRTAFETTKLRAQLAKWHEDVDAAFRGWNGAWLDPEFLHWTIREFLPEISVPVQIIQGEDDQYGTTAQVDAACDACLVPVEVQMLPGVRHSPHREAAEATAAHIARFAAQAFGR
jgi:pimeloyl-ACP methyl ester carboxylesterase